MAVESHLYELLSVPVAATADEISKAYKRLALKYHPDKNNHDAALTEKFKEISRAYEILKDPLLRRVYDQYGEIGIDGTYVEPGPSYPATKRRRQAGGEEGSGENVQFNAAANIFSQVFKDINSMFSENPAFQAFNSFAAFPDFNSNDFAAGQEQAQAAGFKRVITPTEPSMAHGKDIHHACKVTLEDLYYGKVVKFRLPRTNKCQHCDGAGGTNPRLCRTCEGLGQVIVTTYNEFSKFRELCLCKNCQGTGIYISPRDKCQYCNGGYVQEQKIILAVILPGSQDNDRIILKGEADRGHHLIPGDVVIHLKETPHPYLIKKYNDLYMEYDIDLKTALLGGEIILPHFLRKDQHVRILINAHGLPSINLSFTNKVDQGEIVGTINPGLPKIVKGLGMPINNNERVHYQNLDENEQKKNELLDLSRYKKGNLFIKFNIKMPSLSDFTRGEADLIELQRLLPTVITSTLPTSGDFMTSHLANLPKFSPSTCKIPIVESMGHSNEQTSSPPLATPNASSQSVPLFGTNTDNLKGGPVPDLAPPRMSKPEIGRPEEQQSIGNKSQANDFNYNDIDIDDTGVDGADSAEEEEFYNNEWS